MKARESAAAVRVRDLVRGDLAAVIRIDARHTGARKPAYWRRLFREIRERKRGAPARVGLAAEAGRAVVGYLVGEVRAFEFGSDACGWVHAVGVDPGHLRSRVGSALLAAACGRFREAGVRRVRTMVRRDDVPVLSFFRASGFVGGSFVQLELDLEGA